MGMYVAYVYYGLRNFDVDGTERGGDLVLPIIGLPTHVHVVDRPTVVTALVIAMAVAALLGVIVYGLVFRLLRDAPPLARVVASLGVFLYLESVMQLRVAETGAGAASLQLTSLLPDGAVHLGSVVVPVSSFVLAGLAIAVDDRAGARRSASPASVSRPAPPPSRRRARSSPACHRTVSGSSTGSSPRCSRARPSSASPAPRASSTPSRRACSSCPPSRRRSSAG